MPSFCWTIVGRGRKGQVGRRRRDDDEVDVVGRKPGIVERALRGRRDREVGGELALRGDVALLDADALLDPLVGRIDGFCQFGIGEDAFGQIAADASHNRTQLSHAGFASLSSGVGAGATGGRAGKRRMPSDDLVDQPAARHLVGEPERALEADLVGAAMALDDDAVEPEEHAAIDVARIELAADGVERPARQHGAQHREEVGLQRIAQIGANLPRRAFGGLERDVAGKAFGDDDVDGALADVVALDEAVIDESRAARPRSAAPPLP